MPNLCGVDQASTTQLAPARPALRISRIASTEEDDSSRHSPADEKVTFRRGGTGKNLATQPPRLLVFVAGPCMERARGFLRSLEVAGVRVMVRTEEAVFDSAKREETECDALLVIWSVFFQGPIAARLIEITERASKAGALILNDVRRLVQMQDRRWLAQKLKERGLPTPACVDCSRDGGCRPLVEEFDDHISVDGHRINKPVIEKPVDRRDREIYVYFPKSSGGGRSLISTRESGDEDYVCRFEEGGKIRREGSFVYQEYLQSEGFVVQVVCAGGLSYGNALLSGVVTQLSTGPSAARDSYVNRMSAPCAVWLRQEEKLIAAKLNVILHQTLYGLTFVRSQTASGNAISYIVDVWSGIPRSGLGDHCDDVTRALIAAMDHRLPMHVPGMPTRSRSQPFFEHLLPDTSGQLPAKSQANTSSSSISIADSARETNFGENTPCGSCGSAADADPELEADMLCVLLVARHSERTPKQKVKAKVTMPSDFAAGFLCGWLAGSNCTPQMSVAPPATFELRSPQQMARLSAVSRQLTASGHDVATLTDALSCIIKEDLACHAKVGCSDSRVVVSLKWGGELTPAGANDAEAFGRAFRSETYPTEVIDELHATLRHDIKVYASKEPRCQQTAAAHCKGLLRLVAPLPPIIAALVRTDDFGRLEVTATNYVNKIDKALRQRTDVAEDQDAGEAKKKKKKEKDQGSGNGDISPEVDGGGAEEGDPITYPSPDTSWPEIQTLAGVPSISPLLQVFSCPGEAIKALQQLLNRFYAALQAEYVGNGSTVEALYCGETRSLLLERYKEVVTVLGPISSPRLGKVEQVLDHVQYDLRHNLEAVPPAAREALQEAAPLCEALCDVIAPLETSIQRREGGNSSPGAALLAKMRWDLRVASGADLGEENGHLKKHEALYSAAARVSPGSSAPCVRTRLYFSHNSQLQGLLGLMLDRTQQTLLSEQRVRELLTCRLGFLAHFLVRLWRRRLDGCLVVTCDFAACGGAERVRLFELPVKEVDDRWSKCLSV